MREVKEASYYLLVLAIFFLITDPWNSLSYSVYFKDYHPCL